MRVLVAHAPIDSKDPFFYRKTTHRSVYDRVSLAAITGVVNGTTTFIAINAGN